MRGLRMLLVMLLLRQALGRDQPHGSQAALPATDGILHGGLCEA